MSLLELDSIESVKPLIYVFPSITLVFTSVASLYTSLVLSNNTFLGSNSIVTSAE